MGDAINTSQTEAKIPPTETMDHTDPYLFQTQSTPPPAAEAFYSSSSYYPKPLFSLELTKFSTEEYAQLKSLLCDGKPRANFISKIPSFCAFTGSSSTNPWIPDSEATNHIAPPSGLSVTTPLNSTVDLPDGSHAKISGLGSPSLGPNLSVDGVLCVPYFHVNLPSDLTSKWMIGLGKQVNGLYYLLTKENVTTPPSTSNTTTCHLNHKFVALWHQRLGNPSKEPSKF
ncbi:unnamed protein product [Prunus armeniaca]